MLVAKPRVAAGAHAPFASEAVVAISTAPHKRARARGDTRTETVRRGVPADHLSLSKCDELAAVFC